MRSQFKNCYISKAREKGIDRERRRNIETERESVWGEGGGERERKRKKENTIYATIRIFTFEYIICKRWK